MEYPHLIYASLNRIGPIATEKKWKNFNQVLYVLYSAQVERIQDHWSVAAAVRPYDFVR